MSTNRRTLRRSLSLDEFQISEALSGRTPLLGGYSFSGDVRAIRLAWQLHGPQLMRLWRSGWAPKSKFANWTVKEPRAAHPPGWEHLVKSRSTGGP